MREMLQIQGGEDVNLSAPVAGLTSSPVGKGKTSKIAAFLRRFRKTSNRLGALTEQEQNFIDNQLFLQAERFVQEQHLIVEETFRPYATETYVEDSVDEEAQWYRWYWRALAKIQAKILVRRKGTVLSGSRNGAQVCCTHVMATYKTDLTARWLLGLSREIAAILSGARNWLTRVVPARALPPSRRNRQNPNFEFCAT